MSVRHNMFNMIYGPLLANGIHVNQKVQNDLPPIPVTTHDSWKWTLDCYTLEYLLTVILYKLGLLSETRSPDLIQLYMMLTVLLADVILPVIMHCGAYILLHDIILICSCKELLNSHCMLQAALIQTSPTSLGSQP